MVGFLAPQREGKRCEPRSEFVFISTSLEQGPVFLPGFPTVPDIVLGTGSIPLHVVW